MIRRLRDVGLKLKTMFIGWGLMVVLNIIISIVFSAVSQGMISGTIWNVGIELIIQIVFLCLPTGAMATQKEDSKFFENKALF